MNAEDFPVEVEGGAEDERFPEEPTVRCREAELDDGVMIRG